MDIASVLGVLNDLPSTFRRPAAPYTQFVDATASLLTLFTAGADATQTQVQAFLNALDGWLDTWGLLFNIARNANEANSSYAARISETVLAWVGTGPAIQKWLNLFAPGGTVTEIGGGAVGYVITLPAAMTAAQVQAFLLSLNRIRPDGVPFQVYQTGAGIYLGTERFIGIGSPVGAWMTEGTQPVPLSLGATTLSFEPLLPSLLFVDPSINPSFAP